MSTLLRGGALVFENYTATNGVDKRKYKWLIPTAEYKKNHYASISDPKGPLLFAF